jgi:hypothetical protein
MLNSLKAIFTVCSGNYKSLTYVNTTRMYVNMRRKSVGLADKKRVGKVCSPVSEYLLPHSICACNVAFRNPLESGNRMQGTPNLLSAVVRFIYLHSPKSPLLTRVARWFVFKQKIPIWINFVK